MPSTNELIKVINGAISSMNGRLPGLQGDLLSEMLVEIKSFDLTKEGSVVNNVKNIRNLNRIKGRLQKIILSPDYKDAVQEYLKVFDAVQTYQHQYFKQTEKDFRPPAVVKEIKSQTVDDVINRLTEAGIGVNVSDKIAELLKQNITTGVSYASLAEQLREYIMNTDKSDGVLQRYVKQITTDAANQYSAQYMNTISSDLGYEWFRYSGTDILTTRQFCDAMTDKDFFHLTDVPDLLKAKDLFYTDEEGNRQRVQIYARTGLPHGMIPETNPENFFVRRGGYNCGHQIFPVLERVVPPEVVQQTKAKLSYNKWKNPGVVEKAEKKIKKVAESESTKKFTDSSKEIAKQAGADVTPTNIKSVESTVRKAVADYGGNVDRVNDIVRNTFITTSKADRDRVAGMLGAKYGQDRIVKFSIRTHDTDELGYEGVNIQVRLDDGSIAEMQVNTKYMIYAKEKPADAKRILGESVWNDIKNEVGVEGGLGHEYYEQFRILQKGANISKAALNEIIEKSRAYYKKFIKSEVVDASEQNLVNFVNDNPIQQGETQKQYAKRVIDHLEGIEELVEDHSKYFTGYAKNDIVSIDELISVKPSEPNIKSTTNRLWAASKQFLDRRQPISVMKINGGYMILDGNGTYSTAKHHGWNSLPVKEITSVEEIAKLLGFRGQDSMSRLLSLPYRSYNNDDIAVAYRRVIGEEITSSVLDDLNAGNMTREKLPAAAKEAVDQWTSSSDRIRELSDDNAFKLWFRDGVTKRTQENILYRGEAFYRHGSTQVAHFKQLIEDFTVGSVIEFRKDFIVSKSPDGNHASWDRSLMSFTKDRWKADSFAQLTDTNYDSIVFILKGNKLKGFDISDVSTYDSEREVIVGDNNRYRVISAKKKDERGSSKVEIELEEVE